MSDLIHLVPFDPFNWYWLAADGRVFCSRRQEIVDVNDDDYAAWGETYQPTPWPGDQTLDDLAGICIRTAE